MNEVLERNTKMQEVAKSNAIRLLDSLGATYKVTFHDGSVALGGANAKASKRQLKHPYGSLSAYFKPYVEGMLVGDVAAIPAGGYEAEAIRSSLCAWANYRWGAEAATTTVSKDHSTIEVMRLA